jgi:ABC-type sugar transport system substrate-binding protein
MRFNAMLKVAWLLLCSTLFAASSGASAFTVTFVNPGRSDEAFWVAATQGMQMAAKSLEIHLDVRYAERSPERVLEIVKQIAEGNKPDYLVYPNEYGLGGEVLKLTGAAGIKTFFAFSTLPETDFGKPRERYKHWIGSLVPDVEEAGFLTGRALIAQGLAERRLGSDSKLHLLAIAGDKVTPSSLLRTEGLMRAAKRETTVVVDTVVHADFDQQKARDAAARAFETHRDIALVWAGNDLMAFGAIDALEKRGRRPGRDVLFSGINTSKAAMQAVQNRRLASLAGGHFMAGAWALVMLDDYHRGKDFASEGLVLTKPMFVLFTPELAKLYLAQFESGLKLTDFKRFSKARNPNIARYDFRFDRLLNTAR